MWHKYVDVWSIWDLLPELSLTLSDVYSELVHIIDVLSYFLYSTLLTPKRIDRKLMYVSLSYTFSLIDTIAIDL